MEYEINYLILQSKTSRLSDIRKEVKSIIETAKGKIKEEKEFLKRKLAYEINKERFGFHTVLRVEIEDDYQVVLDKIKEKLNLSTNIARYVIINTRDLPALKELDYKKEDREEKNPKAEEKTVLKKEEVADILVKNKKEKEEIETEIKEDNDESETNEGKDNQNEVLGKEDIEKEIEKKTEDKIEKKKKDDKASLDELDEKLDEILNI